MRAAVLHGPYDLRIESVPVPALADDQALIAVETVGLCGSDLHYFQSGRNGGNKVERPAILGHEVGGTVVAAGEHVPGHLHGQRVAVEPAVSCGECDICSQGRHNLCPHGSCLGSPPVPGGLANYLAAPARLLHPVPKELEASVVPLIEPLAVAVHAVRRAELRTGQSVLVTGAGPIGLLVAQAAVLSGAKEVTVVDVNPARLAVAKRYGAHRAVLPDDVTGSVDRALECSGTSGGLDTALRATEAGGRVVLVGTLPEGTVPTPMGVVQRYEVDVVGSFRYASAFTTAVEWAAGHRVDLRALVTASYPLDRTADAFRHAMRGTGLKTVVHCAEA